MSDVDILEEYLLILKSTVEVYVHGTLESSNEDIREILRDGLINTLKHQECVYNRLVDMGSYKVENTSASKIDKSIKKLMKGM